MTLIETFDEVEKLITAGAPLSAVKPRLIFLRDQIEALERDHLALQASHSELKDAHTTLENELAKMNANKPPIKPIVGDGEDWQMEDLGQTW